MMTNEKKICPGCENCCPSDNPQCPKGERYFSTNGEGRVPFAASQGSASGSEDDAVILLMKRCGHYLHHNVGHGKLAVIR
ncbi:MAG: hypothetical protein Q4C48_05015 [Lachnospiraceae bacterium]|nr:hypothetical protein [Lachnospiraceae bacterium]